jgi:hypothetical protein
MMGSSDAELEAIYLADQQDREDVHAGRFQPPRITHLDP